MVNLEFTPNQISGVIVAEKISERLIEECADDIAELYRNGKTYLEIASQYCNTPLSRTVGRNAVSFALEKLLNKEERRALEIEHKRVNGRNRAKSFTREHQKLASQKSSLKRGIVPYDFAQRRTEFGLQTEEEYIISLRESGEYNFRGRWNQITKKVNSIFKNSRKPESVSGNYLRSKGKSN